jgi:hypothetical protein
MIGLMRRGFPVLILAKAVALWVVAPPRCIGVKNVEAALNARDFQGSQGT